MTSEAIKAESAGQFVSRAPRYLGRYLLLLLLIGLSVPTALVAIAEGGGALALPYNLFVIDERLPGVFRLHMLASGGALLLIPLVIAVRRDRRWHRPLGRLTAVMVVLGALTSLPVALASDSAIMARAGFLAQGLVWLALIVAGVAAIRRRDVGTHKFFMIAMATVASGAIWVRLTTAVATSYQLPFDAVYGCVAWAGWMVPLLLVTAWPRRVHVPRA